MIGGINESGSSLYYFKTLDPHDFSMVVGGDLGVNPATKKMNEVGLKNLNPDLIMMGGDISYDNNFPECYRATDTILRQVPHNVRNSHDNRTRLIPMIKAAGNHDFGVNSGGDVDIKTNKHEPLFKHYYPQNTHYDSIPKVDNRMSYTYHVFGNTTLIVSIDSGYDTSLIMEQKIWLESVLSQYVNLTKIVMYHEPIYPG